MTTTVSLTPAGLEFAKKYLPGLLEKPRIKRLNGKWVIKYQSARQFWQSEPFQAWAKGLK